MNNKGQVQGNIILGFFFFILALGMFVAYIGPLKTFTNFAMQSDNLNCKGYLHNGANESQSSFAFNSTLNGGESGSPLGCVGVRLLIPFLIFAFVVAGVVNLLYGGTGPQQPQYQ